MDILDGLVVFLVALGLEDLALAFELAGPVGHLHGDRVLGKLGGFGKVVVGDVELAGLQSLEGFGLELVHLGQFLGQRLGGRGRLSGRRIAIKAGADKSGGGNRKKQRKAAKSLGRHRLSQLKRTHPTVVTSLLRGFYHILRQPRRKVTTRLKNVLGERQSCGHGDMPCRL